MTPVPSPTSDREGSFTASSVLVPLLAPNRYVVKVTAGGEEGIGYLTVTDAAPSTAPAEVFEPLGDRLVRVWYLERSTQVWSFYDPDSDVAAFNTLTEVSSGQNVSIIISSGANIEFQDMTLYPGTNPIALD